MGEDGAMSCYPASVTEHVPGRKHLPAVRVGGVDRGPMDTPWAQYRHLVPVTLQHYGHSGRVTLWGLSWALGC